MIARNVTMHLKANSTGEFARMIEKDVIPLLRKQKGFQDEISFVRPESQEAIAISFWDKAENADAYTRDSYPAVLKALAPVLDGTPQVQHLEVCNSTSHKIAAGAAA